MQNNPFPMHRRSYDRFTVGEPADLILDDKFVRPSILRDLCARGAGLIIKYPLDLNKKLDIIISAPKLFKDIVRRRAKVVWCNKIDRDKWRAGLDFGLDNRINI